MHWEVRKMKYERKTKDQLIKELAELRQRIAELEASETERKQAEEALRESEERLRTIFAASPDCVYLTDTEGRVLDANPTLLELVGLSLEQMQERNVLDFFAGDDSGKLLQAASRLQAGEEVRGLEAQAKLATGEIRDYEIHAIPLRERGVVAAILSVARDITERKRAEEERQRLYEQVQRDAETKATLLNEVNHRVTNNLTAIMGLLQAERSRVEMADQDAYRAIMQGLINRVGGLAAVHRLLSAYEWAPLRLSDVAGQVVRFSLQMLPRHKSVFIDLTPSPVRVTPDQAHNLALVISELATNTVKHALGERDAVHIAVRIVLEDEDDMVRLEYRDDGPGYPEDVLRLERYGVGFELVQNVVGRSLRGELSLHNDGGAAAVIRFKAQADQKPGF
jgi:PAS domain S-box-containing protein